MAGSKRRRYLTAAVGGRRPERFPCRYKRDKCCRRSCKKNAAYCQWNRCKSREQAEMPNVIETEESRCMGTATQQFNNDDDQDETADNDDVKTFDFDNKFESSNGRYIRGKGMQTISEEDLDFPDNRVESITDFTLGGINGQEEDHRTAEHRPRSYSRTLNRTTQCTEEKFLHSPVRSARHKCSRCSRHTYYDGGVQSVTTDYNESLIATTKPKRIGSFIRPCTQGFRCPYNHEISLDAFRSPKRSTTQNSFLWKMATVIYEITGILKDGLVKLLAQDEEAEISSPRDGNSCEDGWESKRNVRTGVERACNNACNCTRCREKYNNESRTDTDEVTDFTTRRNSADCKISTVSTHHKNENNLYDTSHRRESSKRLGIERASVRCTAKTRINTFPPKTKSSGSSISSLSSSSSFRYSHSTTEDERVEKQAKNYCKQDIGDRSIASNKKSSLDLNKENSTSSTETTVVNRSRSHDKNVESYDETDAGNSSSHPHTDIEDTHGVEDVLLPLSSVLVEPEKVYKSEDLEESPDRGDRPGFSDKNKQCRLLREPVGKESRLRDERGFRNEIYYNSQKASETDSATSSNHEYDRRRKRKLKLSARSRKGASRINCQESLAGRNYTVKNIISKTDVKGEEPCETLIQSHLEYFKEVELEEITLEPSPGSPSSRIPRFTRPSSYRFSRPETSGAGGEYRQWDQKLLAEGTDPVGHRKNRNNTCRSAPRSFKSTSHHFYM